MIGTQLLLILPWAIAAALAVAWRRERDRNELLRYDLAFRDVEGTLSATPGTPLEVTKDGVRSVFHPEAPGDAVDELGTAVDRCARCGFPRAQVRHVDPRHPDGHAFVEGTPATTAKE